jgi:hypothetical protein
LEKRLTTETGSVASTIANNTMTAALDRVMPANSQLETSSAISTDRITATTDR